MNYSQTKSLRINQEAWLFSCLKRNVNSTYGKQYGFEKINTVKAYQKHVPLIEYEDISFLIESIAEGKDNLLFSGSPIAFEVTGGSNSGGKLIPYTQESFSDFQRAVLPWFVRVAQQYGIDFKRSYWSISPALRPLEKTLRGIEIGVSDAAYLGEEAGAALADTLSVPQWVGELRDIHDWQLATLYWLICSVELELISVWSPTFLLMLLKVMDERQEILKTVLYKGGMVDGHILKADKEAYERFISYLKCHRIQLLWPNLKLISCWEDAMSKPYAKRLKEIFQYTAFQPKGLICTEGVVTMPDNDGYPLLSAESGFYEFIDENDNVHLADSLVIDKTYEVVMTTNGGLYRYRTGDMVCYVGLRDTLPILNFVGRRSIASDMVGEKLNEAFVQNILKDVDGFAMLIPQSQGIHKYLLIGDDVKIKEIAEIIEERLLQNPQYKYARKIGQLESLEAVIVENVMMHYIAYKTAMGSRVGDIKVPVLQTDEAWYHIIKKSINENSFNIA